MARVLLPALLVAVWLSIETAASSLISDLNVSNVPVRLDDPVDGASSRVEKRVNKLLDCPQPFRQVGNGCYYFEDENMKNWEEARAYCLALGSNVDLAVLDDCYQFEVVWNYITVNDGLDWRWIGGSKSHEEGSWHWVKGTPVPMGTPFWYPGNPNEYGECLALHVNYGYFTDFGCTNVGRFVCEILY